MLLFNVRKNGGVAEISFAAWAFVISADLLVIRIRLGTVHIIDYAFQ